MNYILLTQAYGAVTTGAIASKMTVPIQRIIKTKGGWKIKDGKTNQNVETDATIHQILNDEKNRTINWGNHIFGALADYLFDLNKPSGILLASNKRMSRLVLDLQKVPVPATYVSPDLSWAKNAKYPVIVRPYKHFAGKHFDVIASEQELKTFLLGKTNWYVSEVFDKTHEYRVYTAHGKVLAIQEKPLIPGEIRGNYAVNQEKWRVLKWSEYNSDICRVAIDSTAAVHLDYAAVDVMYNSKNGSCAVAEVNTSPSASSDYLSAKYAAYFSWCIRHDFPQHLSSDEKSVFYNSILRS